MHAVSFEEIQQLLIDSDFVATLLTKNDHNNDGLGRKHISWQTIKISLKDKES